MNRIVVSITLVATILLAMACMHTPIPIHSSNEIEKKVTKIAKEKSLPSISVALLLDNETKSFAYHNPALKPQPSYGIGSATKLLAALVVMDLVEREKIGLEDQLGNYVDKELLKKVDGMAGATIAQLLSHTSGVPDYTKHAQWGTTVINGEAPSTFEEKWSFVSNSAQDLGEFSYSNTNYLLLEKVVEAAVQKPYNEVFDGYFAALGVPGIRLSTLPEGLQAYYAANGQGSAEVSGWQEHYGFDGGAYASPTDLNTLLIKLFQKKSVLGKGTLAKMKQWVAMGDLEIPIGDGRLHQYGHGIMQLSYGKDTYIGHSGGTLKYQSFMFYNTNKNIAVSVLTNCSGQYYNNVFFQEVLPAILASL